MWRDARAPEQCRQLAVTASSRSVRLAFTFGGTFCVASQRSYCACRFTQAQAQCRARAAKRTAISADTVARDR